jgi:hypothetical protein
VGNFDIFDHMLKVPRVWIFVVVKMSNPHPLPPSPSGLTLIVDALHAVQTMGFSELAHTYIGTTLY